MAIDMRPETGKVFDEIVETFSSASMEFLSFLQLVRCLDRQAAEGDPGSQKLLKIVTDFHKLIQVASNPKYQKKG